MSHAQIVSEILNSKQISRFGFTELSRPLTMDFYLNWVNDSRHGEMEYLKNHAPLKAEPQALLPRAKSAIVIAFQYLPHPEPHTEFKFKGARIALYSRGQDYHHWVKARLEEVCSELKSRFQDDEFVAFVDSGPVLERDLARKAGLGWFGKNTCLINAKFGSLFFLSEILTTLDLASDSKIHPDHCGTCRKCIDICPTGALTERSLDARKCISYLTIESKNIPHVDLRKPMGDWLFGCDLCQTVCPWNIKFFKNEIAKENEVSKREDLLSDLNLILTSSNKKLAKLFRDSSLSRASGNKLKRNAMIVIANRKLVELKDLIKTYQNNPYFNELCEWTLKELNA